MLSADAHTLADQYAGPLFNGLRFTALVFVGGVVIATVAALLVGTARLSRYRAIRLPATVFVEIFRGTSALVQLFWVFYALPLVLGITFQPLTAAWIVIGFNQGAYLAEVVRTGIRAVPAGQLEASISINLPPAVRWRRVVLPQAIPIMLPSYTNHVITILKETAIVSLIGIADLTYTANTLRTQHGNTTVLFITIALIYLVVALTIARGGKLLERRFNVRRPTKKSPAAAVPA